MEGTCLSFTGVRCPESQGIAGVTGVFTAAGAASSGKLVCVAGAIGVGERWYRFLRRVPLGVSTM